MGIALFLFFSVTHKIGLFSPNRQQHRTLLQRSPFLMLGMRRGAPRSSRRALTPRRVGAHPARVGARLRLDPRRGRNGGGVGSDAVAGGAGANWATCLRLLERAAAAAAAADVARDGAASTAALSTRVGGVSLRSGRRTERDKKIEKNTSLLWPPSQTQQPTKNTRTRRRR